MRCSSTPMAMSFFSTSRLLWGSTAVKNSPTTPTRTRFAGISTGMASKAAMARRCTCTISRSQVTLPMAR